MAFKSGSGGCDSRSPIDRHYSVGAFASFRRGVWLQGRWRSFTESFWFVPSIPTKKSGSFSGCSGSLATRSVRVCVAKRSEAASSPPGWESLHARGVYTPEEKEALLAAAKAARSPAIYPALM